MKKRTIFGIIVFLLLFISSLFMFFYSKQKYHLLPTPIALFFMIYFPLKEKLEEKKYQIDKFSPKTGKKIFIVVSSIILFLVTILPSFYLNDPNKIFLTVLIGIVCIFAIIFEWFREYYKS